MKCPYCASTDSKVNDKRDTPESIRRRRECLSCGKRFTTYESIELSPLMVRKKDGRKEAFDPEKLRLGIVKACEKRLSAEAIGQVAERVSSAVRMMGEPLVSSQMIGDLVLENLKTLDGVAYLRFAAVYQGFDVHGFKKEIDAIVQH